MWLKNYYKIYLPPKSFFPYFQVKRDSEQLHIIREIQASITDWNMPQGVELKDYGRLRKDSELKVQSHDTNVKTKVRYVFVFDKVRIRPAIVATQ